MTPAIRIVPLLLLLLFIPPARAALIQADLLAPGDGLLTRDTTSGMEWLDLTPTIGVTYNAVIAGFGGFTTTHGFSVARQADTVTLFANAGLTPVSGSSTDPGTIAAGTALVDLLGCTSSCAGSPGAYGFADLDAFSIGVGTVPALVVDPGVNVAWDADGGGIVGKAVSAPGRGVWLLRPTVIPLPSAALLFAPAFAMLFGVVAAARMRR